ncbi:MAG: hypothetical protein HYZ12_06615 [Thaumarchaeota archaeon]|nr:hypothetical protein [Nitrososphaerota archaeon]
MRKKVRIEFQDERGTKYTLAVQGMLTRDKIAKLVDLMELMDAPLGISLEPNPDDGTFFGKLQALINSEFAVNDFSSSDLTKAYEEKYNQPVKLSTISTYLSRLADRGVLRRQRFSNSWIYRRVYLQPESISR